jgi:hypothetical protein
MNSESIKTEAALFIFYIFVGLVLFLVGCIGLYFALKRQPSNRETQVCSGCGAEWTTLHKDRFWKPSAPITRCPECPMTEEEFEKLKEQVRRGDKPDLKNLPSITHPLKGVGL